MGWGPTHTQRVELGRTRALRVVIGQAKRPMCGVRVDLSDCPGGDGWTFMHVGEGHLTWGEEYVCYTLPTGQPHIIRIESPNGVWETGVFTLTRGEIHRFKPEFLRPGLVRLRVVDDTGRPLSPSLVSTRQGSPNWTSQKARSPALARTSGVLAYGDQNGEILLDGIATNRPITLHVEAKGYEFITRVVEIRPEETLDIGDVVLHPATGSVRVEFKHVSDAKHEFIVLLNQVGGSTLNRKTTTGDEVLFSNLSLKRAHYHVLVAPGKGVPGKVYSVSLDRDQPHKDVIVDIRDLASARLRETTAETEAPE